MNFESAESYLKNFRENDHPYDPNGAMHLLKAILENMEKNCSEYDLVQYSDCIDETGEKFLHKLIESIPRSREMNESESS